MSSSCHCPGCWEPSTDVAAHYHWEPCVQEKQKLKGAREGKQPGQGQQQQQQQQQQGRQGGKQPGGQQQQQDRKRQRAEGGLHFSKVDFGTGGLIRFSIYFILFYINCIFFIFIFFIYKKMPMLFLIYAYPITLFILARLLCSTA